MRSIYNKRKWALFFTIVSILGTILFTSAASKINLDNYSFDNAKTLTEKLQLVVQMLGPHIITAATIFNATYFIHFLIKSNKNHFRRNDNLELDSAFSEVKIEFNLSSSVTILQIIGNLSLLAISLIITNRLFSRPAPTNNVYLFVSILICYGIGAIGFAINTSRSAFVKHKI